MTRPVDPMHDRPSESTRDLLTHALATAYGSLLHAERSASGPDLDRYHSSVQEIAHALWPEAAA